MFHVERSWRFDLAWFEHGLAVEVQGGVFVKGRHARGAGITDDCEKIAAAAGLGWRVVPVTPGQIKAGLALRWVESALKAPPRPRFHPRIARIWASGKA